MYQPTIDSHFAARHTHVHVPLGGSSIPDGVLATLGAQVLAARTDHPRFSWARLAAHLAAPSTRPSHAAAR